MIFSIENILTADEVALITAQLQKAEFVDGKTTAGWHAKLVKQNAQLKRDADCVPELKDTIARALKRNSLFQIAVQPRTIHSILFNRYEAGMSYGSHVDNAMMGQPPLRSDMSFTIFLSPPDSYSGGELVIEQFESETHFKLEAGSAIVYPSSFLHRINPVETGVRLAAVGWVQSLIRDLGEREILFELDTVRRSIFDQQGKTREFDVLSKCYANLLRKWTET